MTAPQTGSPPMPTRRPWPATCVAVLAIIGAIGSIVMALAHSGLPLPGPPVPRILPVAVGFAVGAVLFAAIARAALLRRAWAWPAALVVNAIGLASAVMPWRGLDRSGLPTLVTAAALVLLVAPAGRRALPTDAAPTDHGRSA